MDKITSGIIDKLNIVGFFNVILSGGIVLFGISPVLSKNAPGIIYSQLNLEENFEKGIVIVLLCFIIGSALQSIQECLFKGLKALVVNKCLAGSDKTEEDEYGKSFLANKYHQKAVIRLAEKLFSEKDLGEFDPEDKEMCKYFIDYCEYSNTIKGFSAESGRLSESAAFFEQLASAFYVLFLGGILLAIFSHAGALLYCLIYLVLSSIFTGKAYQCHLDWARSVLSTYEVVTDQQMKK